MTAPMPRYPVYIISKGRHDDGVPRVAARTRRPTATLLADDGVPFTLVVEPQEAALYASRFPAATIAQLPFSNLGLGSIPARNWVWQHALASGAARHWILDDNIGEMLRLYKGKRIPCASGAAFAAVEDFVDRYENIAVAGLNYRFFALPGMPPFYLNVHVYSCMLILNALPHRWRGRYNEDTDLCLQVLVDGWCTVLFNAFVVRKQPTMSTKGGNTEELYGGDGRLKMARSLERMWPGIVETRRRFGRPQHVVKNAWRRFDTPLKRRADVDFDSLATNEYGLELQEIAPIKNPNLKRFVDEERK